MCFYNNRGYLFNSVRHISFNITLIKPEHNPEKKRENSHPYPAPLEMTFFPRAFFESFVKVIIHADHHIEEYANLIS